MPYELLMQDLLVHASTSIGPNNIRVCPRLLSGLAYYDTDLVSILTTRPANFVIFNG